MPRRQNEKGYALLSAILFVMLVGVIMASLAPNKMVTQLSSDRLILKMQSVYVAQFSREWAKRQLQQEKDCSIKGSFITPAFKVTQRCLIDGASATLRRCKLYGKNGLCPIVIDTIVQINTPDKPILLHEKVTIQGRF